MNRIYRLVFNAALGLWTAVAENARGRGKAGRAACALLAVLAIISSPSYAADARDASVVGGTGSVVTIGNATTINQVSQRLAIDWSQLSTTSGELLNFNQPNSQAIALNRITGSSPSAFLGSLTANGQVFILNPNGVLFGAGSQVNVGGIVASTLGMNSADFMNGSNVFTKTSGTGSVVNKGSITSTPSGYLALLAPEVRNEGVMTATLGTVLLGAGNKGTLNLNNGSLLGYSIDQGAIHALAENKQLIKADGGQVLLSAKALHALTTATVNNTGVIEAKTIQNIAGRIMLMGDMQAGTVNVGGRLDASAATGDGGFIETSAANVKVADNANITTTAATGKTGTWLIDPNDFTIAAAGGNMTGASVASVLATTNLEIRTATMGTAGGNGDVFVKDTFNWGANTLTLNAERNINFSSTITGSGTGKLVLKYGQGAFAAGNTASYKLLPNGKINLAAGQNFSTQLGSDGAQINYTVITALGAQGSVTGADLQGMRGNLAGNYVLGADISAAATTGWNDGVGLQGFTPVGTQLNGFSGVFDGLGHTVGNLFIKRTTREIGLFGSTTATSALRNVGLVDVNIEALPSGFSASTSSAGLVGYQRGSVANSFVTGQLKLPNQSQNGGLLVGVLNTGASIVNSYSSGSVTGYQQIGGLVGFSNGVIVDSYSSAAVTGEGVNGGLVGYVGTSGSIVNSYTTGSVNSFQFSGGLVGWMNGSVSRSYATGAVAGTINLGGLIGFSTGTTESSYASGSVTGTSIFNQPPRQVGGLIGIATAPAITRNSYATGAVVGELRVGGLIGSNEGLVENTYATGSVTGVSAVGPLIGSNTGTGSGTVTGTIINSFTGANNLTQAATFTGWDIDAVGGTGKVWRIYESSTAPLLRSFLEPLTLAGPSTATYNGTTQTGASTTDTRVQGNAASGRNAGIYANSYFSNQQGVDIIGGPLTINKANLLLSTSNVTKTYDGGLTASGTVVAVGGTQLFTGDTTTGGSFAFIDKNVGAGNKTVTASGVTVNDSNSGGNYNVSYASNTTSSINPRSLTATATGVNRVYDGSTDATVNFADNRVANDLLAVSGGASFLNKNAGINKIVNVTGIALTGADSGNYSLASNSTSTTANIAQRSLTATATGVNRVYNGSSTASVTFSDDRVTNDSLIVTGSASFNNKNVGTGKAVSVIGMGLTGTDAGNYSLANASVASTANITQASLVLSTSDVTKTYDGGLAAIGVAVVAGGTQLFTGDTITGGSFAFTNKNAGTGNKTVTASTVTINDSNGGANYSVSYANNTTSTVTPRALAVSAISADNKIYDQNTNATVNTAGAVYGGLITGDAVIVSATGNFTDKSVANGKSVNLISSYTGSDVGNYVIASQATSTANITPKALTLSDVTASNKVYDQNTGATVNTAGAVYGGLISGDAVIVSATGAFTDKNVANGKTVNLTSSYTGADVGNYTITSQATTIANITPKTLTLTGVTAGNKAYDQTTGTTINTAAAVYGGLITGDAVIVSATGGFTDKNVANGKTVNLTSIYTGADVGNYTITSQAVTTANITPKALTMTGVAASNKVYDQTTAATVSSANAVYSGLIAGDAVIISATGTFTDKNVAGGKTVNLTSSYTGADVGNYAITNQASATANITSKALSISAITVSNKVYDQGTSATVNSASAVYNGLIANDAVIVSATGAFTDKNVANGKTVNLTSSYSGADVGNYAITNQASATANITPKALSISAITASNKIYDQTPGAGVNTSAAVYNGLFANDAVIVSATGAFTDKNAANGKTVNLTSSYTGADVGNYTITGQASATANVTPKALSVSATAQNKVYDASTAASVILADNRIANDVLTVNGNASFTDKNAAIDKTVNVSGIGLTGADANNYLLANTSTSTTADITPRALLITANNDSKIAGGTAYVGGNGVSYGPLALGDTLAGLVGGTPTYSGTSQGATSVGNYVIAPGGLTSLTGNYTLGYASGTLTIQAAASPATKAAPAFAGPPAQASYNAALQGTRADFKPAADVSFGQSRLRIENCGVRMPASYDTRQCE